MGERRGAGRSRTDGEKVRDGNIGCVPWALLRSLALLLTTLLLTTLLLTTLLLTTLLLTLMTE